MFAIVDCNNFYASCERAFRPELRGKPVAVLSNNDGCVIARSNEVKALGIEMGAPYHLNKQLFEKHNVHVFSSNYTLYGDMSRRVMQSLTHFTPEIEVYSIDEAFLHFHNNLQITNYTETAAIIKQKVQQWTCIPVSIGIAPSKALSKMANRYAKKKMPDVGVYAIDTEEKRIEILKWCNIEDVWGIGRQYTRFLRENGIFTAYDYTLQNPDWIKRHLTISGLRLWHELNGRPALPLETLTADKKEICTSRSFGNMLTDLKDIEEALSNYAARCADKLRKQETCAQYVMVFLHTNPFNKTDKQYSNWRGISLSHPTNATPDIILAALTAIRKIFVPGLRYKKAGVIVSGLVPNAQVQGNLFTDFSQRPQHKISKIMDEINHSLGKDKLRIASQGYSQSWQLRQNLTSPRYTTNLQELLKVKA